MERLTEWIDEDKAVPKMDMKRNGHQRCVNKLAELEDLEEQGKLLILPCKPGDTVYLLVTDIAGISYIVPHKVKNIIYCVEIIPKIGKTVYLTEQGAKEALEGIRNDRN